MAIGDKDGVVMQSDRAVPGGVATLDGNGKLVQMPTAADVGALSTGGGVLTGPLRIQTGTPMLRLVESDKDLDASVFSDGGNAYLRVSNTTQNYNNTRDIKLSPSNIVTDLKNAFVLEDIVNGTLKNYAIHHEGNKTTGTYTGNGSPAYRQISTNGKGRLCLITRGGNYWALVSPRGAILVEDTNVTARTDIIFDAAGQIQINTGGAAINENGVEYTYQVL